MGRRSARCNRGHGQVHRDAARSRTHDAGLRDGKTTAGWKVYDIKVAGISLIPKCQPGFARTIRGGGVEGLAQSLSAGNRLADAELVTPARSARPFLFILYAVIPSVFHSGR